MEQKCPVHGPQLVLFTQTDGSDGPVVELKGSPAVDHHAGVPAARAHRHPAAEEASENIHDSAGYQDLSETFLKKKGEF
ncbi:hypothetical protein F7725_015069 [Dissostichus mawsoni]|uniref:Uncharacterized protein n=1 Tax=Dissostichus mawsoni TaxID=36200 RepID=A0A7J5YGE6_DISMA|nr:hypothetical protein F7725_015069 [Dissostichus mawsoni]